MGYSFRLTARVLLYAPSHRQDSTYHNICWPVVEHWVEKDIAQCVHPWRIDPMTHRTMSKRSYHRATSCSLHWTMHFLVKVFFNENMTLAFLGSPNCHSYMVCHHHSVIGFKILSISETQWLCRWICKVILRRNHRYIFSNNTLLGH